MCQIILTQDQKDRIIQSVTGWAMLWTDAQNDGYCDDHFSDLDEGLCSELFDICELKDNR